MTVSSSPLADAELLQLLLHLSLHRCLLTLSLTHSIAPRLKTPRTEAAK